MPVDSSGRPTKPSPRAKSPHRIDRSTYDICLQKRERYRLKPHGGPDADGYQRFTYPKPGYLAIDRATGEIVTPTHPRSITIPLDAGISTQSTKKNQVPAVKHLPKFQFNTPTHCAWYGMRNFVEASNNHFKHNNFEDFGNPGKRSGRGFAFHYLVTTLMVVSSNLRRIVAFSEEEAIRLSGAPLPRVRRRKEAGGETLQKIEPLPASPPQ